MAQVVFYSTECGTLIGRVLVAIAPLTLKSAGMLLGSEATWDERAHATATYDFSIFMKAR
jgi:hypothetical protein